MVEETKEEVKEPVTPAVVTEQDKIDKEQLGDPEDKIARATAAAKRMEDANKKYEELLVREERLKVTEVLGGESELSEKETPEEKVKKGARALVPEGMECPGVTD